ncbi:MAG TPA: endonuclease III [Gemmatimonadaceae bacterium]|jgi:endonuclease-3|nr:endonuclease III [Gemmatimonadaceae bacterium]
MKAKKVVKKAVKKAAKKMVKGIAKKLLKAAVTTVATKVVKEALAAAPRTGAHPKLATKKSRPPKAPNSKEPVLPHLRERWPRNEAERKAKATEYYRRLLATYPDAHCALDHKDAYQLLVATILSAQCTDKRVNIVTPDLFKHYPNAASLAKADSGELETEIKSTGFFRSKTKSLLGMANALVSRHGGKVPDTMEELTELPGVGRKTANVILGNAFNKNLGIVVDTHVTRLSHRLGLSTEEDAVKIEHDLMPLFPPAHWTMVSHLLIEHGRQICEARNPKCEICPLNDICPSSRV